MDEELDERGYAVLEKLLDPKACNDLAALYGSESHFRSRVVMARHGFGRGEYKYFDYPLPQTVKRLRGALYPRLAKIANRWHAALGEKVRFPDKHAQFLERCHAAGQRRATPLLLRYEAGDYN